MPLVRHILKAQADEWREFASRKRPEPLTIKDSIEKWLNRPRKTIKRN